jgi:hypothetical protein
VERFDPSSMIVDSHKVTDIFGYWPTFHDAEVQSFSVSGGETIAQTLPSDTPIINARIHVFEMTQEVDQQGFYVLAKHTLVDLRFGDIVDLKLEGFVQQNALWGLNIQPVPLSPGFSQDPASIKVEFSPSCGLYAAFQCGSVSVASAVPCDKHGVAVA